jgi:DeoR/GlpR family transcriptional regulator of sugar metabolism
MLPSRRKQLILQRLHKDGQIIAKSLSVELALSEDTIRRDLRELAAEGLLQRVHGGALPASPAVVNFAGRQQLASDGKAAIGKAAAGMIQSGQVVAIDGGTTAVQLARRIPRDLAATVVTHSPSIAMELLEHSNLEVVLIGGTLFKHSIVAVGATAQDQISRIRCDIYFMGVTGIHPRSGLTTGDFEEAAIKRALSQSAAETVALLSAEKVGTASPYLVIGLSELSGLITEKKVEPRLLDPYRAIGITVTTV